MIINQDEACQRVWEAVLTQALEDCFKREERDAVWFDAYQWLKLQDDTFDAVCLAAGVGPDLVGPIVRARLRDIQA